MNKRLSLTLVIMLIIAMIYSISITFSYWSALEEYTNVYVTIEGVHEAGLTVQLKYDESHQETVLVPEGFVFKENEVDEITFSFELDLTGDELLPNVYLEVIVTAQNILIDNDATYSYLVEIEIVNAENIVIGNDPVLVIVKVRLSEPATAEIAHAIQGKDITFDLHFNVVS